MISSTQGIAFGSSLGYCWIPVGDHSFRMAFYRDYFLRLRETWGTIFVKGEPEIPFDIQEKK